MAFDVAGARKAGYSDAEIAAHLAKERKFDIGGARKAGYSDADVIKHLSKVNTALDATKSVMSGIYKGAAQAADMAIGNTQIGRMSPTNPFGLPTMLPSGFNLFSKRAEERVYKPQTTAGEYAETVGMMAPNALAPGSIPARAVNVFAPAIASETAGQIARRSGAGEKGEGIARTVGAVGGAGVASLRPQNLFKPQPKGPEVVGARAKQDPAAMRSKANAFRAADIEPTLVDVVDDAGRGIVKAAASKATGGRQAANDFAKARALNLPDRIGGQARKHMSRDPRTPAEIKAQQVKQRSANADKAFGAVRGDEMQMPPETVQALRTDYGRAAIAEAAKRERDPEVRAALLRLANDALDNPSTPITVGMADRISRVLLGQARAAADDDLRGTLTQLGEAVRGPVRNSSTGYREALEGYAADSRLAGAVDVGENLMKRNTDEFSRQASTLAPRERALALASGRRAIERTAGENVRSAPDVARRLATAPEQMKRNEALMGAPRAARFQDSMRLEAEALDNANMVAPGRGSPSFLNFSDDANMEGAVGIGKQIARRDWIGLATNWFRSRGLTDEQAEALTKASIDPARTDELIAAIERSYGPDAAREFLALRNAAMVGGGALTGASRSEPNPERP